MKKIRYLLLLFLLVFLTGCAKEKKYETCTVESNQSENGYNITTTYDVYVKGDVVSKVKQTDVVESEKKDILEFYKKEYTGVYKKYDRTYGGYTYDMEIKDGKLTSKVTIDYSKFNRKKYINDNSGLKEYVNKRNYYTVSGITKMYKNIGAVCKK